MRVVRVRVMRGQSHVKEASPGAIDRAAALSPIIITIAGHVVLPTVILKPRMGYVLCARLFVGFSCNILHICALEVLLVLFSVFQ
jgi:hypothetical protein